MSWKFPKKAGEIDRQTYTHTDVATYRLNRPRGQFYDKYLSDILISKLIFRLNGGTTENKVLQTRILDRV